MKRSIVLKMAMFGAGILTLAACGEAKEEVLTYKSVQECVAAGLQDEATCQAEFDKAHKFRMTMQRLAWMITYWPVVIFKTWKPLA